MLQGEASPALPTSYTDLTLCTVFLTTEPTFIKEFLESYFNPQDGDFPHPMGAAQLPRTPFTGQSERRYSDQSG